MLRNICSKSLLLLVSVFAIFSFSAFAQNRFSGKSRLVFDKTLTIIEDYESLSVINDEDSYDSFIDLFKDEHLLIYNDILGLSEKDELSVTEYADYLLNNAKRTQVFCTDIKRENFREENCYWIVEYSFNKVKSYSNQCDIYFSSIDFIGDSYKLRMQISYSEETGKCKIEKLYSEDNNHKKLSKNFYTFQKTSDFDNSLKYKGNLVRFNHYGQAFLDDDVSKKAFTSFDPDYKSIPQIAQNCRLVTMSYKPRRIMIKAHYDMSIGNVLSVKENINDFNLKSSSNSFALDFGYLFPSKSNCKTGIFVGIGMTQSKLELSYNSQDYYFNTNQDVDGDDYIRHYSNLSLSQNIKFTDLNIPIYFDFNFRMSTYLSFYIDIGARMSLNLNYNIDALANAENVYGIYPKYHNLKLDGNWGYNGFGKPQLSASSISISEISNISKFTVDALGGAGFRFFIPKTTFAIDLGANYLFGIVDAFKSDNNSIKLDGSANASTALIYNTIVGQSSSEHVRSLTEAVNLSRRNFRISIGLAYKF